MTSHTTDNEAQKGESSPQPTEPQVLGTAPDLLGVSPDVLTPSESDPRDARTVACAAALFMRDGLANVRMTDIARATGVGVATLYRRFSTKTRIAIEAATLLWHNFGRRIVQVAGSDEYAAMNGADRLEALLRAHADNLVANPGFVRFVAEFDRLVVNEGVASSKLEDYGKEVDSSIAPFEAAYRLGVGDGSVRQIEDPQTFYMSVAHALMGVAEKIALGDVIPSDDFARGRAEIDCLVDMAMRSVRN